jgi:hypothetical protein
VLVQYGLRICVNARGFICLVTSLSSKYCGIR